MQVETTHNGILDTVCRFSTPEGCDLELRLAGPIARSTAWVLDCLIRVCIFFFVIIISSRIGKLGSGFMLLSAFMLEWFYPIFFEVLSAGKTPGKRATGLAVVHDDGTPIGWHASFIRNTMRIVDFLPFGYALALLAIWLHPQGKRLGDTLSKSVVVHDKQTATPRIVDNEHKSVPLPFPLSIEEQRALIEYRFRAPSLSEERAEELAECAVPLTQHLRPDAAKIKLLRLGNTLLGRTKTD